MRDYIWVVKSFGTSPTEMKMTDSTQHSFAANRANPRANPAASTIGVGAFIVAMLIVAALVLTAIKLSAGPHEYLPSLIPMDQPALHSGFTA